MGAILAMRQNRKTGIPPITGTVVVGYNVTGSGVFYDPKNNIHLRRNSTQGIGGTTVTASSTKGTSTPGRVTAPGFIGNGNSYVENNGWTSVNTDMGPWWMYDHNAPMNARGIIIVAPRSPGIANAGVNFKLQISNDANNWETIMETGKVYPNDSNKFVSIA